MEQSKVLLVGVSDVFFYTKIRDAFRPHGYTLQRIRQPEDVADKAETLCPVAVILNMNDDRFDATQILRILKGDHRFKTIPILAFANHEEVDTWRRAQTLGIDKIVSRNEFSARTLALIEELTGSKPASA